MDEEPAKSSGKQSESSSKKDSSVPQRKRSSHSSEDEDSFPLAKFPLAKKKPKIPILKTQDLMPRNVKLSAIKKQNDQNDKAAEEKLKQGEEKGNKNQKTGGKKDTITGKEIVTSALTRWGRGGKLWFIENHFI